MVVVGDENRVGDDMSCRWNVVRDSMKVAEVEIIGVESFLIETPTTDDDRGYFEIPIHLPTHPVCNPSIER